MKVQLDVVGIIESYEGPTETELDVIPSVGEWMHLPGLPSSISCVREIIWFPFGDPEEEDLNSAFVQLVIGPHRRD